MAKHIIKITKRFTIPMYFNGEIVMSSRIGNSLAHKYIICPNNQVKFIRWSDPDNDFIEVKEGGPAPKLGDNILYDPNGADTKWRYVKTPQNTVIGKALWNAGLGRILDDNLWKWVEEGDEKLNLDPYEYGVMNWKDNNINKVFMTWREVSFKGTDGFEYIIAMPDHFVANVKYKDEIEKNIQQILVHILDKYVQIGTIRETKIVGMYLPPIQK